MAPRRAAALGRTAAPGCAARGACSRPPDAVRVGDQLGKRGAVRDLKLLIHIDEVYLNRPLRDLEPSTHVLVRQPLRHQAGNLELSRREETLRPDTFVTPLGCAPDRRGNK